MQSGEVVVARLGRGADVVRVLGTTSSRVTVALDGGRQAHIPHERVIMETGLVVSGEEETEEFRQRCHALSAEIDLSDAWEVGSDGPAQIGLDSLAELYWGPSPDDAQRVALLLHLEQDQDHFLPAKAGYTVRTRASVEEIQRRRERQSEEATAAESLMGSLSLGQLPQRLTRDEEALLEHLRGYAVHGKEYSRSSIAQDLVKMAAGATRDLQQRCFELLVDAGVFSPDEPLELHRSGITQGFSEEALTEAESINLGVLLEDPLRADRTALPAITIDDAETEDRDDALTLELGERSSSGLRIGIHIADIGALVPHGGALDVEADRKMATLYLPERSIGMLPPNFSRRVGSLDPEQPRLAVTLAVDVTASGDVSGWEAHPSVIRSRAALSYADADLALNDPGSPWHTTLLALDRIAQAWRRKRQREGALTIEQDELSVKVKPSGEVEVKVLKRSTPSRRLVAELMILCNSLLAEFCREARLPAVYRTQSAPDLTDVPSEAQGALKRYLVTRRLPPAELDTVPAPHRGLGVPSYIQVSSPLRRYPDLVMQRQISHFLSSGEPFYPAESITSVVQRAEVQLREIARLEEERKRYWFLKYLQESRLEGPSSRRDSDQFDAVVLDHAAGRTALLELTDFPFRVRALLPPTNEPGDTVTLRLQAVDLWRRVPLFVHAP